MITGLSASATRICAPAMQGQLARGKVLNDDCAEWREAYALFPGDVAYVWHGALHGDVVATDLAACGLQPRTRSSGSNSTSR
jgi:hypothetical protein